VGFASAMAGDVEWSHSEGSQEPQVSAWNPSIVCGSFPKWTPVSWMWTASSEGNGPPSSGRVRFFACGALALL
jgi:hypothetical protein